MRENDFQRDLKKELKKRYPGCYVLKNDPTMIQGIPDLTILYKDKWAALEVKKDKAEAMAAINKKAGSRPNQALRVAALNSMSYAAFIYPENKEEILNELDRRFKT